MNSVGWMKILQRVRKQLFSGAPKFLSGRAVSGSLAGLLIFSAGCASHSAMIIAQRHTPDFLGTTNKICLASQNQPRPEEQVLRPVLTAELEREGFEIVNSSNAEYTLVYWQDNSWNSMPSPNQPASTYYPMPQCGQSYTGRVDP